MLLIPSLYALAAHSAPGLPAKVHVQPVSVSASGLDLTRKQDREMLVDRSIERARAACALRREPSTTAPCHVVIEVSGSHSPRQLDATWRDYLDRP